MALCNYQLRLQTLRLLDLPVELLDLVFHWADCAETARRLSATCYRMRDVSLPYIYQVKSHFLHGKSGTDTLFKSRSLGLFFSGCFLGNSVELRQRLVIEPFAKACADCVSEYTFLRDRPDITGRMERVRVTNEWSEHLDDSFPGGFSVTRHMAGIVGLLCATLELGKSLNSIRMSFVDIDISFVKTFSDLPRLHTLQLYACRLFREGMDGRRLENIKNLTLTVFPQMASLWDILALVPDVVDLTLFDRTETIMGVSADVIHFGNFCNLTRFSMGTVADSLNRPAIEEVVDWLTMATEHHLTHFKLSIQNPTPDSTFVLLLGALQPFPLEELVFDGLLDGEPFIFQEIARCLPRLQSLCLFRRGSDRQQTSSRCVWPSPPWEYAMRLPGLVNLQYFGWNYAFDQGGIYPWSILLLEEVAESDVAVIPYDCWNEGLFGNDDGIHFFASVFAAYSPSLRTVVSYSSETDVSANGVWDIRKVDGRPVIGKVSNHEVMKRRAWNPDMWDDSENWW